MTGLTDGFAGRVESLEKMLADPRMKPSRRRSLEAVYAYALMSSGRAKDADAVARRVRPTVPLRDNWDSYGLFAMRFVGLESGEDWEDLEAYMAAVLHEGVRVGDHEAAGLAAFTLGSLAMERGRYRDAERWLAEAEAQLEHHDTFATVSCIRALKSGSRTSRATPLEARAVLDSLRAQIAGRDLLPAQRAHVLRAEGWGARSLSEAAGAQRFRDDAEGAEDPSVRSRLLYEAMRSGARPANVARELVELTGRCDSRLVAARAAHAVARVDRDGEALLNAGALMATIGADVYALEAAVDAAREFIAEGRMDSARRAANIARDRYHPDHGGAFPVIDGLDGVGDRAHASRSTDCGARRSRIDQSGDRRPARPLGPHRRDLRLSRDEQARRRQPPRAVTHELRNDSSGVGLGTKDVSRCSVGCDLRLERLLMMSPDATPIRGRSLRSTISSSGELRLELAERDVPEPGGSDVVVAVEASPINPSDLGVLLGAVVPGTLRPDGPDLVGAVPEAALGAVSRPAGQAAACRQRGCRHRYRGGPGSGNADRPSRRAVRRVDVG